MNENMKKLHQKFLNEEKGLKICYTLFTTLKPFFVVSPTVTKRETCLCRIHDNFDLMATRLKYLGFTWEKVNDKVEVDVGAIEKMKENTFWWNWRICSKTFEKNGLAKTSKAFQKVRVTGTIHELIESFVELSVIYYQHVYRKRVQERAYIDCKQMVLKSDYDGLLICDFSQNYGCKLANEIQGYHFGSARQQVSLHTSVLYTGILKEPLSFCTVAECLDHDPSAIWAHLSPVLDHIRKICPSMVTLHFFSDGPSTQYKQKKNFYLYTNNLNTYGFFGSSWTYFEAGHGKGAADGIGGAVKRKADNMVAHSRDIPTAREFFKALNEGESSTLFFFIEKEMFEEFNKSLPEKLVAVKGTQSIHQLVPKSDTEVYHRKLACFCSKNKWVKREFCDCFPMVSTTLLKKNASEEILVNKLPACSTPKAAPCKKKSTSEVILVNKLPSCATSQASRKQPLKKGTYILVGLGKFTYAAVTQEDVEGDVEVLVTFFKKCIKSKYFCYDESDTKFIKCSEILKVIPVPSLVAKGNRVYYNFGDLKVLEK